MLRFPRRVFDAKHAVRFFVPIFQTDRLVWAIADGMPQHPAYLALLEQLGFPATDRRNIFR
jgi:hypothetical protein